MKDKYQSVLKDDEKGAGGEGKKNAEDGKDKKKSKMIRNLIIVFIVIFFIVAVALFLAFVDFTYEFTQTPLNTKPLNTKPAKCTSSEYLDQNTKTCSSNCPNVWETIISGKCTNKCKAGT